MSSSAEPVGGAARPFRVGLLGHGTVGAAFAALLERAGRRDRALQRPQAGDHRRADAHAQGDFEEILAERRSARRGDRRDRTRARVPARGDARRQGRGHGQQAAALPARRGAVRDRPRARRAGCASRPPWRAPCRSCACSRSRCRRRRSSASTGSSTAPPTSSSARWRAALPTREALAEAQRRGYAEADPSDDVSGRDAAAKMAILARLAFGTPVHLDDVRYEGIEHLQRRRPAVRARARASA